ncbi:hypothetical protein A3B02_01665 [Candidatus Roizmanbacteria bacterium RIFCSPLOWO2_01_FULL_42_14]|uniref:Rod shape-determining protein RodA n=4 Tax=Candidatus Roizmaniibacteriota TaxID=1752723 RepID=A0A1F7JTS6_9BACT|nr:MAG: hypothetical protein A3D08_03940 [Candidatus Roizmanbacteria bacterium RIFCSPHIGHO2_02_FULL_43_11]OGK37903.1 MAG: hypothetical protein A3F32_01785 [Candidatus Roizmanbacteria bacterium RIFCSPHIGHO2_12_FULL_42_10]OGK51548.1 MAG: hypothetical protein A3B02_01665 [Candidatus Roizmanbacteria bacterium RIFCSPLOWO2_01_FULL_42_14]OGK58992.1 MAG: hypothetical protein A3I56_01430 [Candidatus Roizmanbacteria bacterium RIFCSPLOWO2_02_FULL_43_10]
MEKHRPDVWMLIALLGIQIFGLANILGIRPDLLKNYLLFIVLGWIAFALFARIKVPFVEQNYKLLYSLFIILLVITLLLVDPVRGSRRWIDLPFFRFQTSEFFKPFFLVTLASVLGSANRFTPRKLLISLGLCFIPFLLIFIQPDLSTALILLVSCMVMLYFSGLSTQLVIRAGLYLSAGIPLLWFFLKDYQKLRIIGFINPNTDPQGITYNLNQAIISIGSGGFLGKGMGLGTQARFRFLPEFHTDFAFASLTEQFGFIGGLTLLILFAIISVRLLRKIMIQKPQSFEYLFLIGVLVLLLLEVTINVGMNMGLLPVTGIALPFISYGGSSVISTMIILGMVSVL